MTAKPHACENPGNVVEMPIPDKAPGKHKGGRGKVAVHPPETLLKVAISEALAAPAQDAPSGSHGNGEMTKRREEMGISDRAAEWVRKSCGLAPEEFRARLAERMEAVIAQILVRLEERVGDMAPRDLPFAFGILNDHLMKTRGFGAPVTLHQTNIQIQGIDRGNALAMITGKRSQTGTLPEKPARDARPPLQVRSVDVAQVNAQARESTPVFDLETPANHSATLPGGVALPSERAES